MMVTVSIGSRCDKYTKVSRMLLYSVMASVSLRCCRMRLPLSSSVTSTSSGRAIRWMMATRTLESIGA